ncbi:transcriptional regulator family: Fungal Specific TF [Trichoderma aggressivum f. europaeum]|uniref:Transcriptional regulator family: Fungal Specific TF n=1 Tax=Trichoderma aggressivum f. europaeum TaxID=173218 RepID=A0AAE1M076_9HYPO|nr:transcriptional regulator family: Fungal Specific TF [Trichoderma aggressivum f. europaeum]
MFIYEGTPSSDSFRPEPAVAKMENTNSYNSIKSRQRNILGTFSFLPPLVPDDGIVSNTAAPEKGQPPKRRKQQILRAQRSHRQRTKDYMDALEQEVLRLRAEGDRLNQIATNWKKCVVALVNSGNTPVLNIHHISQFGPGIFLWSVSSSSVEITIDDPALFMTHEYQWPAYQQQSMIYPSMDMIPHINIEDASEEFLLRNFHENVIPTLDVTESTNQGYSKHILPLAFKHQMVRSSILAASASHIQITQGSKSMVDRLNYRSTALAELRQISARPETDSSAPLATILGLMIDDMICGHRECPALLKLAQFWVRKDCPFSTDPAEKATRRFLLDQVQLLKAVVCPLYQFNKLLSKDRQVSDGRQALSLNQKDLFEVFSSMESAVAQACHIYSLPTTSSPFESSGSDSDSSSDDFNKLLDKLQITVRKIPPYSLGENSLTWVYFVAASRSRRIDHNAFFVARLAELLQRIGHDRVNELLAGLI